jgi:hypothetical protein
MAMPSGDVIRRDNDQCVVAMDKALTVQTEQQPGLRRQDRDRLFLDSVDRVHVSDHRFALD